MTRTITLRIEGMSCEACVRHVTEALKRLEGVERAEVSLQNKSAQVVYAPDRVHLQQLLKAVEEEGYEAFADDPSLGGKEEHTNGSQ
ncbi:heavy-metal-associated domain-containing protein [Chthonomonas calidirosea]|uniref:Copper chaperone CopZ n=1 Tax=Chthonomonas calidirosea (strain DSM 23976 / ICMP 18418 / T49) TaxID=1303518 RepID=S0EX48_CHTCT|nr:heavy metal-associated domain-containing protein [Chthonomonas calidirosea]CCW36311.1 Cation transport ATPase [Chthonomonas calidirosea T49]CEK16636.1 cation transport ATPase [Chthonomonas calidirosea]CEK17707.1 cation transport ATPase [Chthonomonas calidirosea]